MLTRLSTIRFQCIKNTNRVFLERCHWAPGCWKSLLKPLDFQYFYKKLWKTNGFRGGNEILRPDYWFVTIDYWLLILDYRPLIIGYWLLFVDCWLLILVIDFWLLIVDGWLLIIVYLILNNYYWVLILDSLIIDYWLLIVDYWLWIIKYNP